MRASAALPVLDWGRRYNRQQLTNDLLAAVIVTIMLIPQSLAYALLAGLPPEVGLYASILPLVGYAIFGTSNALAVGPVAVVSLMTAAAIGRVAEQGTAGYLEAAVVLALLSGVFLMALGLLRLGFLANFLSHPVISGFITASGIIIAVSQLKHLLGVDAAGHDLYALVQSLGDSVANTNMPTFVVGVLATVFLFWVRRGAARLLVRIGIGPRTADLIAKAGPVFAIVLTTGAVAAFDLTVLGVKVVGDIPGGLPPLGPPRFDLDLWVDLAGPAALISIIGFVESVSVAQTLAAKKRQRIAPNQELLGLGGANIAAAFSGGYPVTGGFARSVINFEAGAATPAAGVFTAAGIALAALFLTPFLYFLPKSALAATIIVAVVSLIDLGAIKRAWRYARADFAAMATTIGVTLGLGVEVGVVCGVVLSLSLHLYRTSRPHYAIVGQVPRTQHFRNVKRHDVVTSEHVLSVRIDEDLYFANARYLEDLIADEVASRPALRHVVLMCSAVNMIDVSALDSLEAINARLKTAGVCFHLSEVKGPVMDRLKRVDFLGHLTGQVFLSQFDAMQELDPDTTARAMSVR